MKTLHWNTNPLSIKDLNRAIKKVGRMKKNDIGESYDRTQSFNSKVTLHDAEHQNSDSIIEHLPKNEPLNESEKNGYVNKISQDRGQTAYGLLTLASQLTPIVISLILSFALIAYVQNRFNEDDFIRRLITPADDISQQILPGESGMDGFFYAKLIN